MILHIGEKLFYGRGQSSERLEEPGIKLLFYVSFDRFLMISVQKVSKKALTNIYLSKSNSSSDYGDIISPRPRWTVKHPLVQSEKERESI